MFTSISYLLATQPEAFLSTTIRSEHIVRITGILVLPMSAMITARAVSVLLTRRPAVEIGPEEILVRAKWLFPRSYSWDEIKELRLKGRKGTKGCGPLPATGNSVDSGQASWAVDDDGAKGRRRKAQWGSSDSMPSSVKIR